MVELERLREAIDGLAGLDPDGLAAGDLHELTVGLMACTARLGAVRASVVDRWDRRRVWASNGSRSPSHRLSREACCSIGTGRAEVARARALRAMPHTAAAVLSGGLSLDHVRLLADANQPTRAEAFERDEALLVERCQVLSFADAQRMVDYWCQRVDADIVEADAARVTDLNRLHVSETFEGRVVVDAVLDPVNGAVVQRELKRLERRLFLDDRTEGRSRTPAQRRAAALVVMAQRSAAAPSGAAPARPLFTVHVGEATLAHLCELGNGRVVAPGQLLAWLGTAEIESILFDGPSTVVSVSHRRRFTGAVRRAVLARDRRCQHPSGCDEAAEDGDVDHIRPYAAGGVTSQFNGRAECRPHNRDAAKHDHDAQPHPERTITALDELRARLRWRILHRHDHPDDDTDDEDDDLDDDDFDDGSGCQRSA